MWPCIFPGPAFDKVLRNDATVTDEAAFMVNERMYCIRLRYGPGREILHSPVI